MSGERTVGDHHAGLRGGYVANSAFEPSGKVKAADDSRSSFRHLLRAGSSLESLVERDVHAESGRVVTCSRRGQRKGKASAGRP